MTTPAEQLLIDAEVRLDRELGDHQSKDQAHVQSVALLMQVKGLALIADRLEALIAVLPR